MERKDYSDMLHMERPQPIRPKMDLGNRAKLFASFDALRGFDLALLTKQVEGTLTTRIVLLDDAQEMLDHRLRALHSGDKVTVTYFQSARVTGGLEMGTYITETGEVEETDPETGTLFLSHASIPIPDIIKIESEADEEVDLYAGPDQT